MTLVNLPGGFASEVGPSSILTGLVVTTLIGVTLDAVNEALIFYGRIITSDGASHTIDTTGSSSLQWRNTSATFANAGTTVTVGLAAMDSATGGPARAANVADVITFDVSKSLTGGGGGITANAWQTHVPDAGTKTVANGDIIAFAIQMTARGGADLVNPSGTTAHVIPHRSGVTQFVGGSYGLLVMAPNVLIQFSDGAYGWFVNSDIGSTFNVRTWNSGSATKEYGQLYQFPYPIKVHGGYGWLDPDGDTDFILYLDPLGVSPVAERTVSLDANISASATGRKFWEIFPTPYSVPADTPFGMVLKPGGSNISAYYKTMANDAHRITDPWGTSGYGISRASGAFANANSSLDHYYIGLLVSAYDNGKSPHARSLIGI